MRRNETSLQEVTDLWCERINDLGCKRFCELENKQNRDLSPWYRGGRLLIRREERSILIRGYFLVTSCCRHNRVVCEEG
jgi:hypothetical protein